MERGCTLDESVLLLSKNGPLKKYYKESVYSGSRLGRRLKGPGLQGRFNGKVRFPLPLKGRADLNASATFTFL